MSREVAFGEGVTGPRIPGAAVLEVVVGAVVSELVPPCAEDV